MRAAGGREELQASEFRGTGNYGSHRCSETVPAATALRCTPLLVSGPIPPLPLFVSPPRRRGLPRDFLTLLSGKCARAGSAADQASGAGELRALFRSTFLHGGFTTQRSDPVGVLLQRDGFFPSHINSLTDHGVKSNIFCLSLLWSVKHSKK